MSVTVTTIKRDVIIESPNHFLVKPTVVQRVVKVAPVGVNVYDLPLSFEAGENISALRVVRGDGSGGVVYASSDDASNADAIVGITTTAALLGDSVSVRIGGSMTDSSWNWSLGTIWLGLNGALTQTPTETGALVPVARAISPTRIVVDVEQMYLRN